MTLTRRTIVKLALTSLLCLCIVVFFVATCSDNKSAETEETPAERPSLTYQIQQCSRLYSTECHLHKIVTFDDTKKIEGKFMNKPFSIDLPLGRRRIAIPIEATVKAYVDFSDFSDSNIKRNGEKIEIILPDPKIILTATRVNNDEVKSYVPMLRSDFSDEELTNISRKGREDLIKELPELNITESARVNAARTLIPMITQMGYEEKNITVTFRKDFTLDDLRQLIDNTTIEDRK